MTVSHPDKNTDQDQVIRLLVCQLSHIENNYLLKYLKMYSQHTSIPFLFDAGWASVYKPIFTASSRPGRTFFLHTVKI